MVTIIVSRNEYEFKIKKDYMSPEEEVNLEFFLPLAAKFKVQGLNFPEAIQKITSYSKTMPNEVQNAFLVETYELLENSSNFRKVLPIIKENGLCLKISTFFYVASENLENKLGYFEF